MKQLFFFPGLIFLLCCNSNSKKDPTKNNESVVLPAESKPLMTFFDSVSKKSDLTISQINAHTSLDSFYYSGFNDEASFKGDTVVRLYNDFLAVIVDYSDGKVCSKKIFFVFPTGSAYCADWKEVNIECDRDLSNDYYYTHFKMLNDSCIETVEYFISPEKEGKEDLSKMSERIVYKINKNGKIDTLLIRRYD